MDFVLRSSEAPVLPDTDEEIDLKVSYIATHMYDRHSGFRIANYSLITGHDPEPRIICHGSNLPLDAGFVYIVHGIWDKKKPERPIFRVQSYTVTDELTKDIVIKFLCSDKIRGCGAKTAERLYELYGTNTIEVLKNDPERIRHEVLPRCQKEQIIKSFREYAKLDNIIRELKKYGISEEICNKIYDKYKDDSLNVIKEHPYQLCMVYGVGFAAATRIARAMHIPDDDYERFCAASRAVLLNSEIGTGSTYMPYREYIDKTFEKLYGKLPTDVRTEDRKPANDNLIQAFKEKKLTLHKFEGRQYISRVQADAAEDKFAEEIARLMHADVQDIKDLDKKIDEAFRVQKLVPNEDQKTAVMIALLRPVSIITGGPGCGKTAIMKVLSWICSEEYGRENVLLMAPTGRAARKLNEYTNLPAFTIHHTLHLFDTDEGTGEVGSDTEIKLNQRLIVVDEASMIDIWVAARLVTAVMNGCRLVFVGDANQLQSVRAGAVLRDLIDSQVVPCTKLTKVFRQKDGSVIVDNANRYLRGTVCLETNDKFRIDQCDNGEDVEQKLCDAYVKAFYKAEGKAENAVICLCPMKKGAAGVNRMNNRLQELINPQDPGKEQILYRSTIFREGDLVMETKNSENIVNGDIGHVIQVASEKYNEKVVVMFDNGYMQEYTKLDLEHLVLAYAMTVHKAQGSEYNTVITTISFENGPMLVRNLMYTAFTRAKENVVFIGDEDALLSASFKDGSKDRITLLKPKLQRKNGMFISLD